METSVRVNPVATAICSTVFALSQRVSRMRSRARSDKLRNSFCLQSKSYPDDGLAGLGSPMVPDQDQPKHSYEIHLCQRLALKQDIKYMLSQVSCAFDT